MRLYRVHSCVLSHRHGRFNTLITYLFSINCSVIITLVTLFPVATVYWKRKPEFSILCWRLLRYFFGI